MEIFDKYEIKDRDKLNNLAEIHNYWQIKTPAGSPTEYKSHTGKGKTLERTDYNLDEALNYFENKETYPFIQISFGSSPDTCKEHYYFLLCSENEFEKLKKTLNGKKGKSLGDAPETKTGSFSKRDYDKLEKKEEDIKTQTLQLEAKKEALNDARFENMKADMFAKLDADRRKSEADMALKFFEKETEFEKQRLQNHYNMLEEQLKNLYLLKEKEFEFKELQFNERVQREEEKLDEEWEKLEKAKRIFAKKKTQVTETEETYKNATTAIAEITGKNLNGIVSGMVKGITGIDFGTNNNTKTGTETKTTETPRTKKVTSFEMKSE